jgi:MoxR-like ATPase
LYYWIDYPPFQKELQIVQRKAPDVKPLLARQVTAFIQELRRMELFKSPGVAETIDWTAALIALDQQELTEEVIRDTVGVILKYQDDIDSVSRASIQAILDRAKLQADAAR